jgi:hypothetical protein
MLALANSGFEALFKHYPLLPKALILVLLFLSGYLDIAVFKWRTGAYIMWVWGVLALGIMIGYPPTILRICLGAAAFIFGLVLIHFYFRKAD